MHTHGATTGSIGVFNGIGGCFTDCDEQVSSRARGGTDRR
jgi:hypothetical protein